MIERYIPSALYAAFRSAPFPTLYGEHRTAVTVDVLETGLIFAFCIIAFSFFVVIPGTGAKRKLNLFVRVVVTLFIGTFILLCNFGQEWEYSKIKATTPYRAFRHHELKADIEVKIGLRSVNITLRNETVFNTNEGDQVDYNERFSWAWDQGRLGFGPQAGQYNQAFRAAQVRGAPLPVLWIAEYFTIDGEGIRFGRNYRTAGWYTHILLWTAFPLWLLSIIVLFMVLWYGGCLLLLTGSCILAANIVYAGIRNVIPLEIPFNNGDELVVLRMRYGWCFWMNLVNGFVCLAAGLMVLLMDLRFPEAIATFFGKDVLQEYEDIYGEVGEFKPAQKAHPHEALPSVAVDVEQLKNVNDESSASVETDAPTLRKRAPYSRFRRSSVRQPSKVTKRKMLQGERKHKVDSYVSYWENIGQSSERCNAIAEEEEPATEGRVRTREEPVHRS